MALERLRIRLSRSIPSLLFDIRIPEESEERLGGVRSMLEQHPDWSALVYSNHLTFGDAAGWAHVARKIDPDATRRPAVFTSKYHTTFTRNPPFTILSHMMAFLMGGEIIPTIQRYMKEEPVWGFTRAQIGQNERDIIRWMDRLTTGRKKPLFIIAPEGTRSKTGALGDIEPGITTIAAKAAPAILVPIGLVFSENYRRDRLNTRSRRHPVHMDIHVGEPLVQLHRKPSLTLDAIMTPLVRALPPSLRGTWSRLE